MVTAEQRTLAKYTGRPEVPLIVENGWSTSPYGSYQSTSCTIRNLSYIPCILLDTLLWGEIYLDPSGFTPALNCLIHGSKVRTTCGNDANGGWNQGIMNAALMGDAALKMQCINRARTLQAEDIAFRDLHLIARL